MKLFLSSLLCSLMFLSGCSYMDQAIDAVKGWVSTQEVCTKATVEGVKQVDCPKDEQK